MFIGVCRRTWRDNSPYCQRSFIAASYLMLAVPMGVVSAHAQSGTSTYDGSYQPSISANGGDAACHGLAWERFSIKDGKLSGGLNHSQAGFFRFSGSVLDDGNLESAHGSGLFTTARLEGRFSGSEGTGTWNTTDGQCSETWSATRN